jgi:hypothetical protein
MSATSIVDINMLKNLIASDVSDRGKAVYTRITFLRAACSPGSAAAIAPDVIPES